MSASFAGSRCLDERRRRRLACDPDDMDLPADEQTGESIFVTNDKPTCRAPEPAASHLPLRKVVSHRLWKLWGVGVAALALGAVILAAGVYNAEYSAAIGPGFVRLFNLQSGRAADCYNAAMFVLIGELALLIWWVRSRSLEDFAGRYRMWFWVACAAFTMSTLAATEAHSALSATVLWLWQVDFWNDELLCWMLPLCAVSAVFIAAMHSDMRDCRWSLPLLWIGGLSWLVSAIVQLRASVATPGGIAMPALIVGAAMFGAFCLFMSLLLHSRHVIYETADPPKDRPSWTAARLNQLRLPKIQWPIKGETRAGAGQPDTRIATKTPARAAANCDDSGPNNPHQSLDDPQRPASQPASNASAKTKSGKSATRKRKKQQPPNNQNAMPSSQQSNPDPSDREPSPARSPQSTTKPNVEGLTNISLDGPPDPEMLKGLSKRERRRLRKQWREQQRTGRAR